MRASAAACAFLVTGSLLCATAAAAPAESERLFQEGLAALERGAHDDAIDRFELMADRGFSHPDASYNRALAYSARAQSSSPRPGDLGRAAAALAEAVELAPQDSEAEKALLSVRQEIARKRARSGDEPVRARPALTRAVLDLLPENGWAVLSIAGSVLLSFGLALRLFAAGRRPRLAGSVTGGIGAAVLLSCGCAGFLATRMHAASRPAVVVVAEARLLDDSGRPQQAKDGAPTAIPEGETVYVHEQAGELNRVEWGSVEGYVSTGQLRFLAQEVRLP